MLKILNILHVLYIIHNQFIKINLFQIEASANNLQVELNICQAILILMN